MVAKFKACIVEDNDMVQSSLESLCEWKGFGCVCFDSAELFLDEPCWDADCFIVDYRLPGKSGFELLKKIRDLGYETPAIIASGNFTVEMREELSHISNLFCFDKPFAPSEFLDLLERISREKTAE